MALLPFLVAMVASLMDPLSWLGYLGAGAFIKSRWLSVSCGVAWRLLLYLMIVLPSLLQSQSSPSARNFFAGLASAALATFIVNVISSAIRKNAAQPAAPTDNDGTPPIGG